MSSEGLDPQPTQVRPFSECLRHVLCDSLFYCWVCLSAPTVAAATFCPRRGKITDQERQDLLGSGGDGRYMQKPTELWGCKMTMGDRSHPSNVLGLGEDVIKQQRPG